MGWDDDKRGDYVPPNPPFWYWALVTILVIGTVYGCTQMYH